MHRISFHRTTWNIVCIESAIDKLYIMKTFSVLVAAFTITSSDAFHLLPQNHGCRSTPLSSMNPNTNTESTTDDYVFPSIQFQQMEQQQHGQSRFGIRKTLKTVVTTFATHRELEAAGLIDENDRPEDVNRKAAEKFATFAKRSKMELDALNSSSSTSNELQSVLIETAAALGRTTGQIFGGNEPENYRD